MAKTNKQGFVEFEGKNTKDTKFGKVTGKLMWARLITPNEFMGQSNFIFDLKGEEAEALAEKLTKEILEPATEEIKKMIKGNAKKLKDFSVRNILKENTDKETGKLNYKYIPFKVSSTVAKTGEPRTIKFVDVQGNVVKRTNELGNNSVVKVGYIATPYYVQDTVGVKLSFTSMQILIGKDYIEGANYDNSEDELAKYVEDIETPKDDDDIKPEDITF